MVHILVQEDRKDCLCFGGILAEKVFLLDVVRTLFSRQRFPAVCHIADEVEIVHILHSLFRFQSLQINPHRNKGLFNRFLLVRCFPFANKIRQGSVFSFDIRSRVVDNIFLTKQLAVGIVDRNGLIDNFHSASVFINDRRFNGVNGRFLSTAAGFTAFGLVSSAAVLEPLNLFHGTIPIRVTKEPCHISKIHNDKVCLTFLFPDTGPSPDNLLKGSHALNRLVQNDQLCHLAVCSGGKQFGCRSDNRIRAGHGDEIVKFGFSVNIRTGDSNTVVRIFLDHISVMVDKGDSHAFGMIFGSAEHNSFLHPVGAFQILGNLPCNLVNTVLENDIVIIIPIVINSVFNHIAVYIGLPFVRPPAVTDVGRDIDNLERSKKSILDTLFQAISIDRLSKVINVRYLFALLWCRSHANLCSRRKVLQHFSPVTILLGTSTMTLVYDN